jgi:hypothetical protein
VGSWPIVPSEAWPPYYALWHDRFPLSHPPRPYTHLMRERPRLVLAVMGIALFALAFGVGRGSWKVTWWRAILAFGVGALAGHVFW